MIRYMVSINHKLKSANSVRVSSEAHFMHLTSKIINDDPPVCLNFFRQASQNRVAENNWTLPMLDSSENFSNLMIASQILN